MVRIRVGNNVSKFIHLSSSSQGIYKGGKSPLGNIPHLASKDSIEIVLCQARLIRGTTNVHFAATPSEYCI